MSAVHSLRQPTKLSISVEMLGHFPFMFEVTKLSILSQIEPFSNPNQRVFVSNQTLFTASSNQKFKSPKC